MKPRPHRTPHLCSFAIALPLAACSLSPADDDPDARVQTARGPALHLIDAENAYVAPDGTYHDNGHAMTLSANACPPPVVVVGGRGGVGHALRFTAPPAETGTGNNKQRAETRFGGNLAGATPDSRFPRLTNWTLPEGDVRWVGFSFRLADDFEYQDQGQFLDVFQIKQTPRLDHPHPNAWMLLGTLPHGQDPRDFYFEWRHGSGRRDAGGWTQELIRVGRPDRGVWHDFAVGFRFAADGDTGWVETRFKPSDAPPSAWETQRRDRVRVGYHAFERSLYTMQVGIYRRRTPKHMQIDFDDVRLGRTFADVTPHRPATP